MELRQLEHFVAVAEDGSFTRAARRLGYVQSALSVSIQSLERELSVRLLDRTTHRVSLTDAGRTLLPAARSTLAEATGLRDEAAAINGVVRGRLRIGLMQAFTVLNVPRLLGQFRRAHPQVELTLRPSGGGAAELVSAVATGELDLAFVAVADLPRGLLALPLASESLCLISAETDAPSHQGQMKLRGLADASFVDFPVGWGIRTIVDRAFAQLGVHRRVGIEVADTSMCVQLVREGLGVALLPESLISGTPGGSDGLHVQGVTPAPRWDLAVVTRGEASLSPAAAAFIGLLEL